MKRSTDAAGAAPWHYWRPAERQYGFVEWCSVRGTSVALPVHFHDEDQITLVISGRRRFFVGDELIELGPGEMIVLLAGTAHASLREEAGVHCFNAYLSPGTTAEPIFVGNSLFSTTGGVRVVSPRRPCASDPTLGIRGTAHELGGLRNSIKSAAIAIGMSREGFSRAFRRETGMPPRTYRVVRKLNRARELLRHGMPIASAAAMAGFADQSHLGHCFRTVFGVTPGAYRNGSLKITKVPDTA